MGSSKVTREYLKTDSPNFDVTLLDVSPRSSPFEALRVLVAIQLRLYAELEKANEMDILGKARHEQIIGLLAKIAFNRKEAFEMKVSQLFANTVLAETRAILNSDQYKSDM